MSLDQAPNHLTHVPALYRTLYVFLLRDIFAIFWIERILANNPQLVGTSDSTPGALKSRVDSIIEDQRNTVEEAHTELDNLSHILRKVLVIQDSGSSVLMRCSIK